MMTDYRKKFYLEKFQHVFFAAIMIFWLQIIDYIKTHFHIRHILFKSISEFLHKTMYNLAS